MKSMIFRRLSVLFSFTLILLLFLLFLVSPVVSHVSSVPSHLSIPTISQALTSSADVNVEISPGYSQTAYPGDVVTFTHILTNTGSITDIFSLNVASKSAWLFGPQGSTHLTNTHHFSLQVSSNLTQAFSIGLSVPTTTLSGTLMSVGITATSQTSPTVNTTVVDVIQVNVKDHRIFLPSILMNRSPDAKLGVDFSFMTSTLEQDLPVVESMGANWFRYWLSWPLVESSPKNYNWSEVDAVINTLKAHNFKVLLVVYGAPAWAADLDCGPVNDIDAFDQFLEIVINRYQASVDAWEFTNEPDGKKPHQWSPIIGCWGPYPDAYAAQLNIFYKKVKAIDPGTPVLFGGLAYDNWEIFDRTFFDRSLQAGAGNFFDILSLHYYPINPLEFPTIVHKVKELQTIMQNNGVINKQIWITETGMWVNENGSLDQQRNFIVQEFSRAFCNKVGNLFWFAVLQGAKDPPLHRWLINSQHQPDNAYETYQHFANKIVGSRCKGQPENVPNDVEAYEFTDGSRIIYILWSKQGQQSVTIPATTKAVLTDRDGKNSENLPVFGDTITFQVNQTPLFVEVWH